MITAGKALLVLVTIVCLLSIGGAMLFAFPVLVPLHWLAMRSSPTRAAAIGWTVLAVLSLFEGGWMLTFVLTDDGTLGALVGAVVALGAGFALLRSDGARDLVRRP